MNRKKPKPSKLANVPQNTVLHRILRDAKASLSRPLDSDAIKSALASNDVQPN